MRHRVLKWARFVFRIILEGLDFRSIVTFFACGQSTVGQMTAKNEMWASEVCFACLTWLYGLFVRTLISRTNAYAGCGRPTLNFIETQMNYEMNCITMHKCTEMFSKRPEYTGECQSCTQFEFIFRVKQQQTEWPKIEMPLLSSYKATSRETGFYQLKLVCVF